MVGDHPPHTHSPRERKLTDSFGCRITLTKTDWMMASMLSGENEYTFFDYCNMRLHQVNRLGLSIARTDTTTMHPPSRRLHCSMTRTRVREREA
jgi:hypothetical protein